VSLSGFSGQPRVAHGAWSLKSPLLGKHCECEFIQRVLQADWLVSFWSSCNEDPDHRCLGCRIRRLTTPLPSPNNVFHLIITFNWSTRCLVRDLRARSRIRRRRVLVTAIAMRASANYESHTRSYGLLGMKTWQMSHRCIVGVHGRRCVLVGSFESVPALESDNTARLDSSEERTPLIKQLPVVHRRPKVP
jgi:hypothetical protein